MLLIRPFVSFLFLFFLSPLLISPLPTAAQHSESHTTELHTRPLALASLARGRHGNPDRSPHPRPRARALLLFLLCSCARGRCSFAADEPGRAPSPPMSSTTCRPLFVPRSCGHDKADPQSSRERDCGRARLGGHRTLFFLDGRPSPLLLLFLQPQYTRMRSSGNCRPTSSDSVRPIFWGVGSS